MPEADAQRNENDVVDDLTAEEIDALVLYEVVEPHIAVLTFNRPGRKNALLSPHSFRELERKVARAEDDDDIKVIVLTGAGEAFCSGVDLRRTPVETAGQRPGSRLPQSRRIHQWKNGNSLILDCAKTVICAVDGPCVAGGFNYAIQADIVVASDRAVFGEPESRIGYAGFSVSFPILALKAGVNRARAMLLTGRMVSAEEMHRWGVVESVVEPGALRDEALKYARAVAWHSTDNLMIGRRSLRIFWSLVGAGSYEEFVSVAQPLFSNVVWRDDEFNFLKERNERGVKGALQEMRRQWEDIGF